MQRLAYFDEAKAIGLIAVVVGHTSFVGIPATVTDFCYSFHMPLFFIISGYFIKVQKASCGQLSSSAKRILIPYLITSVIIVLSMTGRAALIDGEDPVTALLDWTMAAIYGSGSVTGGMPTGILAIGAIWYLWAFFWAKLLLQAANETQHPAFCSLILFIVGIMTKDYIWLPFSVQPALCATVFLYIGQYVKSNKLLESDSIPKILWICMMMTWIYCGLYYGQLYMVSNTYMHGAIDVIGAVCGSLCIIKFFKLLLENRGAKSRLLEFIGSNTLPFFCMHLVELNVIRWDYVIDYFGGIGPRAGLVALLIHAVSIGTLSFALYLSPCAISGVFFPSRKVKATESD